MTRDSHHTDLDDSLRAADVALDRALQRAIVASASQISERQLALRRRREAIALRIVVVAALFTLIAGITLSYAYVSARVATAAVGTVSGAALTALLLTLIAHRVPDGAARRTGYFIKRVLDMTLGALAIVALLPLYAAIATALFIEEPGLSPVQGDMRIGRNGRVFRLWLFRTLGDPAKDRTRRSRLARLLISTGMNELPGIFNVIGGDMSFIGPRPPRQAAFVRATNRVSAMRPGLTGPADFVRARSTEEIERIERQYEATWSLRQDLLIALRSVAFVVRIPARDMPDKRDR